MTALRRPTDGAAENAALQGGRPIHGGGRNLGLSPAIPFPEPLNGAAHSLFAVLSGRNANLTLEHLRKMAWAAVSDLQAYIDHAPIGFDQELPGSCHPQSDKELRRGITSGFFEQPAEVVLTHPSYFGQVP